VANREAALAITEAGRVAGCLPAGGVAMQAGQMGVEAEVAVVDAVTVMVSM
jgi:hypothetical protein